MGEAPVSPSARGGNWFGRNPKLFALGVIASVLFCVGMGICFYLSTAAFVKRATRTQGVVVQHQEDSDGLTFIIAEFTDREGKTQRVRSSWKSSPPTDDIGEKVDVLYDPAKPSDARFVGLDMWLGVLICAGLAVVITLMTLVMVLLQKRFIARNAARQEQERGGVAGR